VMPILFFEYEIGTIFFQNCDGIENLDG